MTYTVTKSNQKKSNGTKQAQDLSGDKFEDAEDEEDDEQGESATPSKLDLIQLVHDSNAHAAELFFQFSQADEDDEKQELFNQIKNGLKVHSQLVEELYYPLLPASAKDDDKEEAQELVFEAEASNYVASMILDVLETMKPSDDYFDGKMAILHKLCKEQTKREEKEMFEKLKAAETEIDFEEVGRNAVERKMELEEEAAARGKRTRARSTRKPATQASAGRAGKKPVTRASNKSGKRPATKASASRSGKRPATKASASRSGRKPATQASASRSAKKPATQASASRSAKKPATQASASRSAKKPATKASASKSAKKPATKASAISSVTSQRRKRPLKNPLPSVSSNCRKRGQRTSDHETQSSERKSSGY
jgi:hypothetical protein